jgi:uncharacterized protein YjbI with pentapeptide repeats
MLLNLHPSDRDLWLPRADVGGAYLPEANLRGAVLTKANPGWPNLAGADLTGSSLYQAEFAKPDLHDATMPYAAKVGVLTPLKYTR